MDERKCYAIVYTDRWSEDNIAEEIYLDKELAEKCIKQLNDSDLKTDGGKLGFPNWFYVVSEMPLKVPDDSKFWTVPYLKGLTKGGDPN